MPKILLVDDDVTVIERMEALVKMGRHGPTTVTNSLHAYEFAKSVGPDLITLDLTMPACWDLNYASSCMMIRVLQALRS